MFHKGCMGSRFQTQIARVRRPIALSYWVISYEAQIEGIQILANSNRELKAKKEKKNAPIILTNVLDSIAQVASFQIHIRSHYVQVTHLFGESLLY